jgi:hypothetical protein
LCAVPKKAARFLPLTIALGETQGLDVAGHCGLAKVIAALALVTRARVFSLRRVGCGRIRLQVIRDELIWDKPYFFSSLRINSWSLARSLTYPLCVSEKVHFVALSLEPFGNDFLNQP